MKKDLKALQAIDPSARVLEVKRGPSRGKFYVFNSLWITSRSPRFSGEAPVTFTAKDAVSELWQWIDSNGGIVGVANGRGGTCPRYKWNGSGWDKLP